MKRTNKISLAAFLFSILFIAGCKSTKEAASMVELQRMNKEERIEQIKQRALQYNTLSASAKFKIATGGESKSIDGQFRIKQGECVQMLFRIPLLGEVARMQFTPEEILFIDHYNKKYVRESISELKRAFSFDIDYHDLESLFSNQLFMIGYEELSPELYPFFQFAEDRFYAYLSYSDSNDIEYTFKTNYDYQINETVLSHLDSDITLSWAYDEFADISDNQSFPLQETIHVSSADEEFKLSITLKNIKLDSSFPTEPKISSKYERIDYNHFIRNIRKP